ncbi:transglycosylase SLT domain-containing protein [Campylobacter corcagiensis]|uniref:Transglycosylase SLT domain-containing protein n=1 Tax=Campylobacter corcagiensis TaxID=1448857 RepID=A0A6M8N8B5_9BACT|nr:transglycosylase SLT domain-containing protein [Campylobacter corcagiensis]QKF65557.1 VirB1 family protein [Campylobacter corcagiensis]QOQ86535.1 transglycosylase SLT domain-containing protein [Campylobacter corcagiensis]
MKVILVLFLPFLLFSSDIKQEIANSLKIVSYQSELNIGILYTIASIESNFNPYIISFVTSDIDLLKKLENGFKDTKYNFKYSKYGKKQYLANISSVSEKAMIKIADFFWDMDFNIDFGIMQISKQNLTKSETKYIFNPLYNISKSSSILTSCNEKYKDLKNVIECYNKGFVKKNKYNYYAKFQHNYNKFFGVKK